MKKQTQQKINELKTNPAFIEFYCYHEDKWLQYATWEEKLIAVFGNIENAIKQFKKDGIFNFQQV